MIKADDVYTKTLINQDRNRKRNSTYKDKFIKTFTRKYKRTIKKCEQNILQNSKLGLTCCSMMQKHLTKQNVDLFCTKIEEYLKKYGYSVLTVKYNTCHKHFKTLNLTYDVEISISWNKLGGDFDD